MEAFWKKITYNLGHTIRWKYKRKFLTENYVYSLWKFKRKLKPKKCHTNPSNGLKPFVLLVLLMQPQAYRMPNLVKLKFQPNNT